MKKGLIGRKLGMTQVYDDQGVLIPVTVIECGPCTVIAAKTVEKDGYSALQLGFGSRKAKNVSKAVLGNLKPAGLDSNPPAIIKEIRLDSDPTAKPGDVLGADVFAADEYVDVTGTTKGRGFQGVVHRFHTQGGRETHGGAWTRRPGSIGNREWPARVFKNKKLPGQMGSTEVTTQNLRVVKVMPEDNAILVEGAVPGPNGGIVLVRKAIKKA